MKYRLNRVGIAVAHALAIWSVAGCGGADGESTSSPQDAANLSKVEIQRWRSRDQTAPAITIESQSTIDPAGQIALGGTASDDQWLYTVRWSNDRGGQGLAKLSGTKLQATWSASGIQLQAGDNTITVTAQDAAGHTSRASIVVTLAAAPAPAPAPAPATYSATISWALPQLNTDGTSLADVVGYQIAYGTSQTNLTQVVTTGASPTSATIDGLAAGTYYFSVTTLNSSGGASATSSVVSKTLP
jgi:predicted phage tail protein